MPIKWKYTKEHDRYAQCYRLQELLRLEFNAGNLTREQHEKLEDEVINELLKLRAKIKNNALINTDLTDVSL